MARNNTRNPRNPQSDLFRSLTKIFSGPIVNRRTQSGRRLRRNQLDKYASRFQSASGQQFKRSNYLPFGNLQPQIMNQHNRTERYVDFDQMEYTPEIASAIDIYADEMTAHSSLQDMLQIKCSNEEIKGILNSLYHEIMNVEHNLFGWCRTMCKYGDFFLYLDIDDKFGIRSTDFASQVISAQVLAEKIETVQTLTEHSAFTGTKTNVVAVDSKLQLDTSINFDSHTGNFDDGLGFFDGGSGAITSSGTYAFANAFDFNSVLKFNVLLDSFIVNNINFVNNFDSASGNFDARQGLFDGGSNASVDTNAILQVSTSQDASTYTSFQDFKAGDYVARAVKFRVKLTSNNTQESPQISALALKLSLPTRTEKGSNISSTTSTSGKTVTFGSEYYQTPSLTVIGQNMATGDFFTVTSKSRTGFTVEFFNSSGSTVDRTFDFQANGIGMQQ